MELVDNIIIDCYNRGLTYSEITQELARLKFKTKFNRHFQISNVYTICKRLITADLIPEKRDKRLCKVWAERFKKDNKIDDIRITVLKRNFLPKNTYEKLAQILNELHLVDNRGEKFNSQAVRRFCIPLIESGVLPKKRICSLYESLYEESKKSIVDGDERIQALKEILLVPISYEEIATKLNDLKFKTDKGKRFYASKASRFCHPLIKAGILPEKITPRRNLEMRKQIIILAKEGKPFHKIGEIFDITQQRVAQLIREEGYSSKTIRQAILDPVIEKFNKEFEDSECFSEVVEKIREEGYDIKKLRRYGLKFNRTESIKERNSKIAEMYRDGKSANEILSNAACKLTSRGSIYGAVKIFSYQKFPQIKRGVRGAYEDEGIMQKIIHLREKRRLSFARIAKQLNDEDLKTITGKEFYDVLVLHKYKHYNKHHNRKPVKKFRGK